MGSGRAEQLPVDARADRVLVHKAARSLELYRGSDLLRRYPISLIDWANGCIAVTDREIDEILRVVPDRTPIEILP